MTRIDHIYVIVYISSCGWIAQLSTPMEYSWTQGQMLITILLLEHGYQPHLS